MGVATTPIRSSLCQHPNTPAERQRFSRRVRSGTCVRPFRSLYAPADEWTKLDAVEQTRQLAIALAKLHPTWVFCLFTAAALYGLEIGRDHALPLHAQTPRGYSSNCDLIQHPLTCAHPDSVGTARVTPAVQTVVDCLLELPFSRGLAVADSALRGLGLTKKELFAELEARPKEAASKRAESTITYADPRAANGGESVARAVMIEQGFMVPELQAEMRDPLDPSRKYFADFRWQLSSGDVVGELDGRDKYVLPEMTGERDTLDVVIDERHRESRLTAPGVKVMRFTFRDVMDVDRFISLLELYGIPRGAARIMDK